MSLSQIGELNQTLSLVNPATRIFPSSLTTNAFELKSSPTNGYVLTSDVNGNGTWQAATLGPNPVFNSVTTNTIEIKSSPTSGYLLTSDASGNGTWQALTSNPTFVNTITTDIKISNDPTNGYVLTSDTLGNGTWQPSGFTSTPIFNSLYVKSSPVFSQIVSTPYTINGAISINDIVGGIVLSTPTLGVATLSLPTGTAIESYLTTYLGTTPTNNTCIYFTVENTGTSSTIISNSSGTTIVTKAGSITIILNTYLAFKLIRTAVNAYSLYGG